MKQDEFAAFSQAAIPEFARDKVQSGQCTEAESPSHARQVDAELLLQGLDTPDNFPYTLHDAATSSKVGVLRYACRQQAGAEVAYVYEVLVHPGHRRQGHARRAYQQLELEVRERGLAGIALHFFGHHAGAQHLYGELGCKATNVNTFKAACLTDAEGTAASEESGSPC
jgi:GNAT superfamily N-acetyltransferase